MLHPRFTTVDGAVYWASQVGPYGAWGDLQVITRWGDGASGMFEAQWTMPLPADFDHPALRRGTMVELMSGPWRAGSPLILSEPARGSGFGDPWQLTATGIGREVEGDNSFYAEDGSGNATAVPSTAATTAMGNGWAISGVDSSVPSTAVGASTTTDGLNTLGSLFNAAADSLGKRWGVGQDNVLRFYNDPTTPTYIAIPESVALGVADDDYASVVKVRYLSSSTGLYTTATSINANMVSTFRRREYAVDLTGLGAISAATAQGFADGILAKTKGRLGWTDSMTVSANQLLTMGGVPASPQMVLEDVAQGCIVRIYGVYNDLLRYNGQTWLDVIIGQATYADGSPTIQLDPLGLAPRDLAKIVESVTGKAAAA